MKAKIINVSEVDKAGNFEVKYQILSDKGVVLYDNLSASALTAKSIKDQIINYADNIKQSLSEVKKIAVGEEIDL